MKISVVIPLYNKRDFIEEAVASIVAQTRPAFEIIVVDDGSTDGGADRVAQLQVPQLRLIRQPNGGVSVARNRGISEARGDYIAFLDADDRYLPTFLERIFVLAELYPSAGMLCTAFRRVFQNGAHTISSIPRQVGGQAFIIDDFFREWCYGGFACTNSIVVRRDVLTGMDLIFPPGERLGEDQDVWFRVAEFQSVAYINQPLIEYRIDIPGSATQGSQVLIPLPCFERLSQRVGRASYPICHRLGARRLVSSHWINVAKNRAQVGDVAGAMALLRDPRACANTLYWMRTFVRIFLQSTFKIFL